MTQFIDLDKRDQTDRFPENTLIIIDNGDTFEGSPIEFEECFIVEATPEGLEEVRSMFGPDTKIEILTEN